jgi:hypothetical protein
MQKLYTAPGHLLHVGVGDGLAAQLLLHIRRQQALHPEMGIIKNKNP